MTLSSSPTSQTSQKISTPELEIMEDILDSTLEGPDDVLVVTRENFLEILGKLFAEIPFVAVNLSRTRCTDKTGDGNARGAVTVAAVGFEAEYIKDIPSFMQEVTGVPGLTLSTNDDTIDTMLREAFTALPEFTPAPDPDAPITEEPTAPLDKTVLSF